MTFKTFALGLLATFGFPWLALIVVPFARMRAIEPVRFTVEADGRDEIYVPRRPGRVASGAAVYAANGCYVCHTQLIRPTFAGSEFARPSWAGAMPSKENPTDTRRETTPYDFAGEPFAQIGLMRYGPDLSNLGNRIPQYLAESGSSATPEQWLFNHLYNPRGKPDTYWSICPSQRQLFVTQPVEGQGSGDALRVRAPAGLEIVPGDDIRTLASYLLSLRKDDPVPAEINYSPAK